MQLLLVADLFKSPTLMNKAVQRLELAQGTLLQATCKPDGALH